MGDVTVEMTPLTSTDPASVGPFRLVGVLGSGGMGRVYLGESLAGRRVAIKVIRPDLAENPAFRRRFQREVTAARTVSPLYTAAVVDADTGLYLPDFRAGRKGLRRDPADPSGGSQQGDLHASILAEGTGATARATALTFGGGIC